MVRKFKDTLILNRVSVSARNYRKGKRLMLFNKYETKFIKTNKNDVIKGIKSNSLSDIFVMEPVDKSNTKSVKLELDKLVRSGEVSIVIMKHK